MHRQQGLKTSHLWLSAPQKITWLTRRRDATKINAHVSLSTSLISLIIPVYTHPSMSGSDTEARKELTSHFGAAVADHPDVMSECKSYPNTNISRAN